ncbi:phosphatidylinositol-specific phospholipase C domain-containing protein [Amycolatopsis acidicola]|uniref:phosphatidylinositol-specific phospholipase C domain-containing protein n=1 Tax=Amycolatopsis acidicola TaxID=2596893 RepID=UPI001FB74F6A|nr:phosphatidylinositol-specific phospholipase C domain-containing protein [Amycolatopsis acidicola]
MIVSTLLVAGVLAPGEAYADTAFADAVFRATHNSYSGNVDGAKGSITYQLDHGVRFVEFDIHDNDYGTTGDYAIGHSSPGDLVDHAGNPSSNKLRDWLATVNTWSDAHPSAAPIVVMLDLKDDLTDNTSYAAGNLAALDTELTGAFGANLVQAKDYPNALPSIGTLRGKVLTLLSGDATTRAAYKRDVGYHPAVAVNSHGQVVEVHDNGGGALWYWTGQLGADGRITWLRHGRYDSGQTPAVALNDNGQLVEVHQSQSATTLWSHVGQLGADGEITWSASKQYDNGVLPTVAFTGADTVREVHRSQSSSQNWQWQGTLSGSSVTWTGNAKTSSARYDKSSSRGVTVSTGADGATPAQTLRYTTAQVAGGDIRYPQTAFDEYQAGDSAELKQGALFYAATATDKSFITSARSSGHVVRGWDFDDASLATDPLANYPATNHPWEDWYENLVSANGVVQ